MAKKLSSSAEGFTLIEVVLVLAIAGLIMVIVFLAIGGAQRTRRDTTRKNNAGRVIAAVESYASNNGGTYPTATLGGSYLTNVVDPNDGSTPTYGASTATGLGTGKVPMYYASGNLCSGGAMTTTGATSKSVAVSYWSEVANAAACVDNK